jgi:hypothetical protein
MTLHPDFTAKNIIAIPPREFWNYPVVGGSQVTTDGIHENTAALIALKNSAAFTPGLLRL